MMAFPRYLVALAVRLTMLLSLIGASIAASSVAAQPATPGITPPESCLAVETFPLPAGDRPHDVAPAADGNGVWYTAQGSGALGLLDPQSGEIERIELGDGSSPHGVMVDGEGAAWVTDGGLNALVRVDAETFALDVFPVPFASANLNTPVIDGEGIVWFTGQTGVVGRLDPATAEMVTLDAPRGRGPYGITATPDGDVYFVSLAGSYLGALDWADGVLSVTEIDPPTAGAGTRRVWTDSHGILWMSEWDAGQVARYEPDTDSWQEWRLPGDQPQAYAVYVDERDDVWLSDFGANALVRFDPDTEEFASVPLPDLGANVRQIHGRHGEVWGAESGADKLVVVRTEC
ncbi:MAG: virginiamycin B lyase family protein [Thermomicrobiales bacterium]